LFFHKGCARFDGFLFRDLGELLSNGVVGLFIFAGIPSLFQLALSRFLNQQLDRSAIRFELALSLCCISRTFGAICLEVKKGRPYWPPLESVT